MRGVRWASPAGVTVTALTPPEESRTRSPQPQERACFRRSGRPPGWPRRPEAEVARSGSAHSGADGSIGDGTDTRAVDGWDSAGRLGGRSGRAGPRGPAPG